MAAVIEKKYDHFGISNSIFCIIIKKHFIIYIFDCLICRNCSSDIDICYVDFYLCIDIIDEGIESHNKKCGKLLIH